MISEVSSIWSLIRRSNSSPSPSPKPYVLRSHRNYVAPRDGSVRAGTDRTSLRDLTSLAETTRGSAHRGRLVRVACPGPLRHPASGSASAARGSRANREGRHERRDFRLPLPSDQRVSPAKRGQRHAYCRPISDAAPSGSEICRHGACLPRAVSHAPLGSGSMCVRRTGEHLRRKSRYGEQDLRPAA